MSLRRPLHLQATDVVVLAECTAMQSHNCSGASVNIAASSVTSWTTDKTTLTLEVKQLASLLLFLLLQTLCGRMAQGEEEEDYLT